MNTTFANNPNVQLTIPKIINPVVSSESIPKLNTSVTVIIFPKIPPKINNDPNIPKVSTGLCYTRVLKIIDVTLEL